MSHARAAATAVVAGGFAAAGLVAIGWLPTARLAGAAGTNAMLAGTLIALAGGWAGLVPILRALPQRPADQLNGILLGTVLRFVVTLGAAIAFALGGLFAPRPLVLWVAIAQMVLIAVDTMMLLPHLRRTPETRA